MTPDAIEQLARLILPELADVPVYGLLSSQMAGPVHKCTYGFYSPHLDLAARSQLQAEGRDRGRGVAVCLNNKAIWSDTLTDCAGDEQLALEVAAKRYTAVAIHEFGHALESRPDLWEPAPETAPAVCNRAADSIAKWCATDRTERGVPWHQHDARFVRLLCHLVARYERETDERVLNHFAFCAPVYSLSALGDYQDALADELASFDGSLFDLPTVRPPQSFVDLWFADIRRYAHSLAATSQILLGTIDAAQLFPVS